MIEIPDIKTDADNESVLDEIDAIFAKGEPNPNSYQGHYLKALIGAVVAYEKMRYPMPGDEAPKTPSPRLQGAIDRMNGETPRKALEARLDRLQADLTTLPGYDAVGEIRKAMLELTDIVRTVLKAN